MTRPPAWDNGCRVLAYTRRAPLLKASSTSACPIPRLAPVTRTVLPASVMYTPSYRINTSPFLGGTHQLYITRFPKATDLYCVHAENPIRRHGLLDRSHPRRRGRALVAAHHPGRLLGPEALRRDPARPRDLAQGAHRAPAVARCAGRPRTAPLLRAPSTARVLADPERVRAPRRAARDYRLGRPLDGGQRRPARSLPPSQLRRANPRRTAFCALRLSAPPQRPGHLARARP